MTKEEVINKLKEIIANAKEYQSSSMDDDFLCYDHLMTGLEELLKQEEWGNNWEKLSKLYDKRQSLDNYLKFLPFQSAKRAGVQDQYDRIHEQIEKLEYILR